MTDTITLTGTLEDYRSQVQELNEALDSLDASSQEYANTLAELQELNTQWAESIGIVNDSLSQSIEPMNQSKEAMAEVQSATSELREETNTLKDAADTNFKGVTDAIVGVVPGLNTVLLAWKNFQAVMMTNPWIAVLTAALTAIVALFKTFSDAIKGNEETSKKWKTAMAALQPVINAIKNAIDWLAQGFVNMVSAVMSRLPKMIRSIGDGAKTVTNVIANIVDGLTWIPRQIAKMWQAIIPMVTDGLKKVLTPIMKGLDAIGLDEWTNKIQSALNSLSSGAVSMASNFEHGLLAAGDAVRGLGSKIQSVASNFSNSMTHSMKLQQEANDLQTDTNNLLVEEAKTLSEINDLRNEARQLKSTDPARAQELLNKAEQKSEELAERKVRHEERTLKLMREQAALAPNSAADNRALAEQEAKVWKTRSQASRQLNKLYREQENIQKAIAAADAKRDTQQQQRLKRAAAENAKRINEAEKQRKAELKAAHDAEVNATKEAKQLSTQIYNENIERIKLYAADYSEFKRQEEAKLNLKKQLNTIEKHDRIEYENERYKREMQMYKDTIDEYIKLVNDANVLETEKHKARIALDKAMSDQVLAQIQHDINVAKIDAEEIQALAKRLKGQLQSETNKLKTDEATRFAEEQAALVEQYRKGEINAAAYLKQLEELRKHHNNNINQINIQQAEQEAKNAKTVAEQMIKDVQNRYANLESIVKAKEDELNQIRKSDNKENIKQAEQTYNTLKGIYEAGENGLSDILTQFITLRLQGVEEIPDTIQNLLQPLMDAADIDTDSLVTNVNNTLQQIAEVLGINLDDMLTKWQEYYDRKAELTSKITETNVTTTTEAAKAEIEQSERQMKQFTKITDQMSKTMNAVSNYWEQSIEQRLEAGEISKEQAEEEFERLKQFNIAQAVVDTISGALSAYMSVWKTPSLDLWAKIAMSVLMGAQTLASGYAQIKQIQQQTLSTASAGGESSSTNVIVSAATPVLNEAQDIRDVANISMGTETSNENIRVYVVESDITDAQNRAKVRVTDATF